MTEVQRQLAHLKFYREIAAGELALVTAARDFFLHLPETHALGAAATTARLAAIEATQQLAPLLSAAVNGLAAQIEAIEPATAQAGEGQPNAV